MFQSASPRKRARTLFENKNQIQFQSNPTIANKTKSKMKHSTVLTTCYTS